MKSVAAKTWREVRVLTFAYAIILELGLLAAVLMWPTLRTEAAAIGRMLPAEFLRRIADAIASPSGDQAYRAYMAMQMFFKGTNVVGLAFAVLLGTGIVARERETQTLEFLLGRPIARSQILLGKVLVIAAALVVPIVLTSLSAIPLSWIVEEDLEFGRVLGGSLHASAFALVFLGATTLASVGLRTQVHVASAIGALIILQVVVYFVQQIRVVSVFRLSDFDVYGPLLMGQSGFGALALESTLWLLLAAVALHVVADRAFARLEL